MADSRYLPLILAYSVTERIALRLAKAWEVCEELKRTGQREKNLKQSLMDEKFEISLAPIQENPFTYYQVSLVTFSFHYYISRYFD